jgi:hypothetical protein
MSKAQHTPEPWIAVGRRIKQDLTMIGLSSDAGVTIGSASGGSTSGPYFVENDEEVAANAHRIVACVNACAGYSTDDLELFGRFLSSGEADALAEHHALIEQQRDELLAALESALKTAEFENHPLRPWQNEARAAIAKAADYRNPGNTACITTGE